LAPQIRCPNCGTTINLKSRRETDFRMILTALEKGSKTFTDLLKITDLPRKTLSLRLKELCDTGIVVKDGGYKLNGTVPRNLLKDGSNTNRRRIFSLNRKQILLLLLLICIGIPTLGPYVIAMFRRPQAPPLVEEINYGTLIVYLKVQNVEDLCAWQVKIQYDPNELVFENFTEGDFFKSKLAVPPRPEPNYLGKKGNLLIANSIVGMGAEGVSGSGTLAIIKFKIITEKIPSDPSIVFDSSTYLFRSNKNGDARTLDELKIPNPEKLLYLTMEIVKP